MRLVRASPSRFSRGALRSRCDHGSFSASCGGVESGRLRGLARSFPPVDCRIGATHGSILFFFILLRQFSLVIYFGVRIALTPYFNCCVDSTMPRSWYQVYFNLELRCPSSSALACMMCSPNRNREQEQENKNEPQHYDYAHPRAQALSVASTNRCTLAPATFHVSSHE